MPLVDAKPDALANIYANSLMDLADAEGGQEAIERTLGELEAVLELAREDAMFSEFLASRVLSAASRAKSLEVMLSGKLSDLTYRFVQTLNQKGRLSHLPAIVSAFDAIAQERFGRIEVDVFTAEPLSGDALDGIRKDLADALGKDVVAHPYVDGSMIGGVKLRLGDKLIDASVATQLRQVRDRIIEEGGSTIKGRASSLLDDTTGQEG